MCKSCCHAGIENVTDIDVTRHEIVHLLKKHSIVFEEYQLHCKQNGKQCTTSVKEETLWQ